MAQHILLGSLSASSSITSSKSELTSVDTRVKWESMKTFLYLAETYASSNINFDIFSGSVATVPLWLYWAYAALLGMPYMCMDLFIKQYTGKIDFNETLNPLVKSVNYAIMVQSSVWTLLHACDLSEAVLFLMSSLVGLPPWLNCEKDGEKPCVAMLNISMSCEKSITLEKHASHYIHYRKLFISGDRSVVTRRVLLIALVWIVNFFITTLSEQVLTKFFKICFIFRTSIELFFVAYVGISTKEYILPALTDMIALKEFSLLDPLGQVMYTFGVGLVGVYDFGAMSPFTAVDNAVVAFAFSYISMAFLRSIILKVLFKLVRKCIKIEKIMHYHYFIMAILPLGSMFIKLQRLIMILIFLIMITTLCPHLVALTCSIGKLLHSEFRTVKYIYFCGFLSFFGFILSSILALYVRIPWVTDVLRRAIFSSMLLLSFLRVIIVMYLYGVQKFAEDMHFWLDFKPSMYWIVAWSIMPAITFYFVLVLAIDFISPLANMAELLWRMWIGLSVLIILLITLKTIGKYATSNKLQEILRPSPKYGPPEADERKRRKRFDETVILRQCGHDCIPLDDRFECNHDQRVDASALKLDTLKLPSEMSMFTVPSEMFDVQQSRD